MDDIQTRLKETSQNCLDAYITWEEDKKDLKAHEELHSAIHELRRVSSRLEIELAISERDQVTSKPIPIPSHRSNSKGEVGAAILDTGADAPGNGPVVQSKPKRRRPPRKQGGGN